MMGFKLPAVFVSDFGPLPAKEDDAYTVALAALGEILPKPKSILIMSGHWESDVPIVSTAKKAAIIHDYSGFPPEFYAIDYPAPGNPILASECIKLLSLAKIPAHPDTRRGLDHGAWVPLSRIYPKADIPVVQITTLMRPEDNLKMGQALSSLREKGVLLIAAGALSHNLRLAMGHEKNDPPDKWALELDNWLQERLDQNKTEELLEYRKFAPSINLAAPTSEHFNPLFFVLGAAGKSKPTHHHRSIRYANGIMRIISFE